MKYFLFAALIAISYPVAAQKTNTASHNENSTTPLKLYPNPADKYVNVYVTWSEPQSFTYTIYDKYDALIKETKVAATQTYQMSINTERMGEGDFYILLKTRDGKMWKEPLKIEHK